MKRAGLYAVAIGLSAAFMLAVVGLGAALMALSRMPGL